MLNRILRRIAVASSILGAVVAASSPAAAQETTVRMWTFLNPSGTTPRDRALAEIIENFETANPNIDIVVETQAFDQMSPKFLAAHGAGTAPDVIWVIPDFLGDAVNSGSLADLNELFINRWEPEHVAAHAGAHWDLTSIDGKQYALFLSRNYISLVYRPDLFAEAGIDVDRITTWDAFLEAIQQLTVRDVSGQVTRYGFAQGFSEQQAEANMMIPMVLAAGETLFNEDGTASFATPAGVEAMTFQTDLVTKHKVQSPQSASWTIDDVYEQFMSGRAAIVLGASVRVSTLQASLGKDEVGLMLFPGAEGEPRSPAVMAGWAIGVWSGSEVKEAAGQFLEYMLSPEADEIWVTVGGQSPNLSTTIDKLGSFMEEPGNEFLSVAAQGSAEYGWLTPIEFSVGGYRQVLNKAAQRVLIGGLDPETALQEAEAEFNRQHNR